MNASRYRYEIAGSCLLIVHGDSSPSDDEVSSMREAVDRLVQERGYAKLLILGLGRGILNASQRSRLIRGERGQVKVAIVSDSSVVRGAATALSWTLGEEVQSFGVAEQNDAFDFLDLVPGERELVRGGLSTLAARDLYFRQA